MLEILHLIMKNINSDIGAIMLNDITLPVAFFNSISAIAVFCAVVDNCIATALSPTVGTAAFAFATIFTLGYE